MEYHKEGIAVGRRETVIVDPSVDDRWDRFVERHPSGSLYHLSAWKRVIEDTYAYQPYYFASQDVEGGFQGILPVFDVNSRLTGRRLISLPFSPYAGPLAHGREALDALLDGCKKLARSLNAEYVQIRCSKDGPAIDKEAYRRHLYYKIHVLDLAPTPDRLMAGFHQSCIRRPVRKSLKGGLALRIAENEDDMRVFFRLQVLTRKRHGLPPQPYSYFKNIWRVFSGSERTRLLMAVYGSQVVASILLFRFKDTVIYQKDIKENSVTGKSITEKTAVIAIDKYGNESSVTRVR